MSAVTPPLQKTVWDALRAVLVACLPATAGKPQAGALRFRSGHATGLGVNIGESKQPRWVLRLLLQRFGVIDLVVWHRATLTHEVVVEPAQSPQVVVEPRRRFAIAVRLARIEY